jgi:hypothetical protein
VSERTSPSCTSPRASRRTSTPEPRAAAPHAPSTGGWAGPYGHDTGATTSDDLSIPLQARSSSPGQSRTSRMVVVRAADQAAFELTDPDPAGWIGFTRHLRAY